MSVMLPKDQILIISIELIKHQILNISKMQMIIKLPKILIMLYKDHLSKMLKILILTQLMMALIIKINNLI